MKEAIAGDVLTSQGENEAPIYITPKNILEMTREELLEHVHFLENRIETLINMMQEL